MSLVDVTRLNRFLTKLKTFLSSNYAPLNHTHSGYAYTTHTHSNYATTSHTHSDYFSKDGGTINGGVDIKGVLKIQGNQAIYYDTTENSQTIGTNNATGGTNICCGSSADVIVNGANMKAPTILPRATNTFYCGNSNYRWKGIYSTSAVNVSSDARQKRNIVKMDSEALERFVKGLNVVSYNYITDPEDAEARIGLVAQDVQNVDPEIAKFFVDTDENGMLSIKPADLVFPLIVTIQKLSEKVEELSKKNTETV